MAKPLAVARVVPDFDQRWSVADIVAVLETCERADKRGEGEAMRWEYHLEPISFVDIPLASKTLNDWAGKGWEVVAVIPEVDGKDLALSVVVLKRPYGQS
jgi:hypothetical protein